MLGYLGSVVVQGLISNATDSDPDMNDANNTMVQTSVFAARGFLIESTTATW
jgi:hypothetical protein